MNDQDIAVAVRRNQMECDAGFRNDLEALLLDEFAGRPTLQSRHSTHTDRQGFRARRVAVWGAVALVAASVIGAAVVNRRDSDQVNVIVEPPVPGSDAAPSTTLAQVTSTILAESPQPAETIVDATQPPTTPPSTPAATVSPEVFAAATSIDGAVVSIDSVKVPTRLEFVADLQPGIASFQPDGSVLVVSDTIGTLYSLDGRVTWSVPIVHDGGARTTSAAIGPDGVLYVAWSSPESVPEPTSPGVTLSSGRYSVSAIPYVGDRSGTVVRQWLTTWTCSELSLPAPLTEHNDFCGQLELRSDGFALSGTETARFVDDSGNESGAIVELPESVSYDLVDAIPSPEGVQESTLSGFGRTWRISATYPFTNGVTGDFLNSAAVQPDGTLIALLQVGQSDFGPASEAVVLVARPDGTITQYQMPSDEGDIAAFRGGPAQMASVGGVLYGISDEYDSATGELLTSRILRIVPAG